MSNEYKAEIMVEPLLRAAGHGQASLRCALLAVVQILNLLHMGREKMFPQQQRRHAVRVTKEIEGASRVFRTRALISGYYHDLP